MKPRLGLCGLAAALLLTPAHSMAHHSRAMYDLQRNITIEGIVTEFEWANPHVYLHVETRSDSGGRVVWEIEHGSTTAMGRRGWSSGTFRPGDNVLVRANPAKDSTRHMALVSTVTKDDVTLIGRGSLAEEFSGRRGSVRAVSLTGTWVIPQGELVDFFSEPVSWPLTAKGIEAVESYDDETMNPQIRCISRTAPWFMIFPGVERIDIGDTSVSIRSEYDTIERTVHMGAVSHGGAAFTHQGHSIGWWEGEVLVVDTTRFSDHRSGSARGVPSGSRKHLVERFELNADRTALDYRFELKDPEYLAAPVRGGVQLAYRPDIEFMPVQCDLENARRFLGN